MKTVNLNIRIKEDMRDEFKRIAESNAQTPSALMRMWIESYIKENKLRGAIKMTKTWEFENYTVHDEQEVLRFENNEGDIIGYVSAHDHSEEMIEELDNGVDPIESGWEDGLGNTINIDGWGEFARE